MENSTFLNSIWAITPDEFARFASYDFSRLKDPLEIRASDDDDDDDAPKSYKERLEAFMRQFHEKIEVGEDGTGTLRIEGPIMPNPDIYDRYYFNACDSVRVAGLIRAAAGDESIERLVLHINSPGGMVVGTPEVGEAIREFNASGKESIAFADTLMASAAYWIGSQASSIATTGSALVGSIGVIRPHVDATGAYEKMGLKVQIFRGGKHKVAGAMGTAMSKEQTDHIQAGVDACHERFQVAVNYRRKVDARHMEGQVFYGEEAQSIGLVDRIVSGIGEVRTSGQAGSGDRAVSISVDRIENAMSNSADTPPVASPGKAELDSAFARVGELEGQLAAATEQVTLAAEQLSAAESDLAAANERITALETSADAANAQIADLNLQLESAQANFDAAVEAKAKELAEPLAEAKAAEIAARAGTDAADLTGAGDEGSADQSAFASMTDEQKWAHCASLTDKDEQRAFYLKHIAR